MFWFIVTGISALVLVYIVRVLSGNVSENNSFDAFIVESSCSPATEKEDVKKKYHRRYESPGRPILILYGTEYGFSEEIAKTLFDRVDNDVKSKEQRWQPRLVNMKDYLFLDFHSEQIVFIVVSTAGDGVPPTEARSFFHHMEEEQQEPLAHLGFSVLALGDSNYPYYCRAGKTIHQRLLTLSAKCVVERMDIDQEDWPQINAWIESCVSSLADVGLKVREDYLELPEPGGEEGVSRSLPFMATLKTKYDLTEMVSEDDKETIHCEFDLTDSGISWTSGDSLGIYPTNCPGDVDRLMKILKSDEEEVLLPHWAYQPALDGPISLRTCLAHYYDLKTVRVALLEKLRLVAQVPDESSLLDTLLGFVNNKHKLDEYLAGHEVADVLQSFPKTTQRLKLQDLLQTMRPLQPRYYSMSSSPFKDPNTACVTAAVVRYTLLDIPRTGVCTTFLQDRMKLGDKCPVFVSHNPDFRLPKDPRIPIIMVGPGTGIAPFRAFIQERGNKDNCGQNLLYFGCRKRSSDFLYKKELEDLAARNVIQLRVAFSRDQKHKVYVQHLIQEDGEQIYHLIEKEGAHIYVCGDAKRMAHDVHQTLCDIIQKNQPCNAEEATTYLQEMEKVHRYQKDVWVT